MIITIGNVTVEGDAPEAELIAQAAVAYLTGQLDGSPTQEQIDALIADYHAAAVELGDFADLLPKISTELAYINATLGTIDAMTAAQVRDVVKRLLLEQQAELKAWRYVIRRLTK